MSASRRQRGDDALAGATVLGGVVQYVAQHLLQPFRIAGDRIGVQFAVVVILQTDAILSEQLLIGVNGVLKLRLQVHVLDAEGKTAVLHLGELQQFLHHVGESAGFLEDNVQTPAQLERDRRPPAVSRSNH